MPENNHIEEFFKKHLASQEFAFQDEDWHKMEKKLELSGISASNISQGHFPLRILIIILAAITMAFFLGWLTSELVRKIKGNKVDSVLNQESSDRITQKISVPSLEMNSPALPDIHSAEKLTITDARQSNDQPIMSAVQSENSSANDSDPPGSSYDKAIFAMIADSLADDIKGINNRNYELVPQRSGEFILIPLPSHTKRLSFNYSGFHPVLPVEESQTLLLGSPFTRITFGLLMAPDFNSTGIFHHKRISPVFGGIIAFRVSSRWWISARVLYNNKKYKSSADYYHITDEYWQNRTNGILPDNIDGSCRVLDIPVLFTYRFYQKKAVTLSASAGLGSYFLFDEKYRFTFAQDNPGAATQWQTKDNSKVLFGVANLALGLSLQTGPRTSIGFEPYLKLPLKHMGWGKVNLSGMGLAFSLNYHL